TIFSRDWIQTCALPIYSYLISPRLLVDASHSTNASTTVNKGDHIYFRVNSSQIPEELVDVTWNPTVTYTDNLNYSSTFSDSFLQIGRASCRERVYFCVV